MQNLKSLADKINHKQIKVVVVVDEDLYLDFSHVVHIYYTYGVKTRRFYSSKDAEEFLVGMMTAFETMS